MLNVVMDNAWLFGPVASHCWCELDFGAGGGGVVWGGDGGGRGPAGAGSDTEVCVSLWEGPDCVSL